MPEQHTKGDTSTIVLEKENEHLTPQECDILGEIANISFGSASTVLSTILNRQVSITAPRIELVDLYDSRDVEVPHVVLNIHFTKGLDMENLLVLKQDVALSIADLMMMGTGEVEDGKELGELELSAVQEAMNQMMGFAATSMSEFFQDTVDMSPPTIKVVKLSEEMEKISEIDGNHTIVKVSFDLKIDNLVNSKLVQIVSVEHAKQMVNKLMQLSGGVEEKDETAEVVETEIVEEVEKEHLTQEEKDVLGEIANISIGSASTVLSTLLNQPVTISTPNVEAINVRHYDGVPVPFVILNVDFVEGLKNENVFVFTKDVALTMVDLMMMGTGEVDPEKELTELELSGIKEIMNQMMGHAATAMSEMFQEKMDMTPPNVKFVTLKEEMEYLGESMEVDELVQITFNLEIGDLLQSKMYQILPIYEAKEMVRRLLYPMVEEEIATEEIEEEKIVEPVVQPIEFKEVKQMEPVYMDTSILQNVEMNVKFVFGSTVKTIQDILSLQENEAVVLDEDIDEPIRIYVNDVLVAYGELVNVDGFFGVKVTKSL
ncbi:flagellar motor switch protein [Bacillus thuringiensis]|uniref:Flagellar motor switch phosphatase FliY n=7 Tax=Bacillus cereus group TaxID=86661 RepID=A0A9W3TCX7_BACTU|nr:MULTISPECIES: flagellar motor switch protein [Bacillus]MED1154011.1 flagellar motor switch protein [Bacillus paranthracis]AFQ25391.1 flagellar motor switch protein [Bacillus thuringiensis HD-789]AJH08155.1 flagellar motor switch FliM family protein [Bacillus thuringiensis HD1002]AND23591.1 flagellar motor switch protein [Bacillus thuringiensis serovar israelensis]AQY38120.1 flagellar motor switch phosphatase FliY [Bacillus thuringiensis]